MTEPVPVIEVADLWKRYRRPPSEVPRRLRHARELRGGQRPYALRGVSLAVARGESVALLGSNGSGKSSLLRVLAGTSRPTSGSVTIREPTYGLLTLGEGMHPLLTGRENAVTGAMLAGLSAQQAQDAVPEIAAFAELADVLDAPLRTYSEGMKLRLAFATSMVVDPQVLLIDEVLAVGDLRFRERCLRRLRELRQGGVTTVFVSHDLAQVRDLCDRAVWLSAGEVVEDGPAERVVEAYELAMYAQLRGEEPADDEGPRRTGDRALALQAVRLTTAAGPSRVLRSGSAACVEVDYDNPRGLPDAVVTVSVHDDEGRLCLDLSTEADALALSGLGRRGSVSLQLDRLDLADGDYTLDVGLYPRDWSRTWDHWSQALAFSVRGATSRGVLTPPRQWAHVLRQD